MSSPRKDANQNTWTPGELLALHLLTKYPDIAACKSAILRLLNTNGEDTIKAAFLCIKDKQAEYDTKYNETASSIANLTQKYEHKKKTWSSGDKQEYERLEKLSSSLRKDKELLRSIFRILQPDVLLLENSERSANKIARIK
tara:strand:+ start:626 stop:1051 length:426 start_codon:yes stop_codon:yes gene_type:complete